MVTIFLILSGIIHQPITKSVNKMFSLFFCPNGPSECHSQKALGNIPTVLHVVLCTYHSLGKIHG